LEHFQKLVRAERHLLPTPNIVSIIVRCFGGAFATWMDPSARDAYTQYVKEGVIRDQWPEVSTLSSSSSSSWGARSLALFYDLHHNPLWKVHGIDIKEFVDYVPRALETYTDTLGRLVMQMQKEQEREERQKKKKRKAGIETKNGTVADDDPKNQDAGGVNQKNRDDNDDDNPFTTLLHLRHEDNTWIGKAYDDPDSYAGRLSRMTTPRMFHDHFLGAELFRYVNTATSIDGIGTPTVTYVAGSSVVRQCALLSAQIAFVDPNGRGYDDDDDDDDTKDDRDGVLADAAAAAKRIEQKDQQQQQQSSSSSSPSTTAPPSPTAPSSPALDAARPVAARIDVLYEIQQSYRPYSEKKIRRRRQEDSSSTTTTTTTLAAAASTAASPPLTDVPKDEMSLPPNNTTTTSSSSSPIINASSNGTTAASRTNPSAVADKDTTDDPQESADQLSNATVHGNGSANTTSAAPPGPIAEPIISGTEHATTNDDIDDDDDDDYDYDDDGTAEAFAETNLLVASFEGWLQGGPDGTNELRWKVSQVRDAREFS
jgi:hypothetical protein